MTRPADCAHPDGEAWALLQPPLAGDANRADCKSRVTAPLSAHMHEDDDVGGLAFVASALIRGQGKTEGLHRRRILATRNEDAGQFDPVKVPDAIGHVANVRADNGYEAGRWMRRALILMMQDDPVQARLDDASAGRKVDPWVERFFGDDCWTAAAATRAGGAEVPDDHRLAWRHDGCAG